MLFSVGDSVRRFDNFKSGTVLSVAFNGDVVYKAKEGETLCDNHCDLVMVPRKLTEDECYEIIGALKADALFPRQLIANLVEHFASNCMIEG